MMKRTLLATTCVLWATLGCKANPLDIDALRSERDSAWRRLVGAAPGSLGPEWITQPFGTVWSPPTRARFTDLDRVVGLHATFSPGEGVVEKVIVKVTDVADHTATCRQMREHLERRWGRATLNPTADARVHRRGFVTEDPSIFVWRGPSDARAILSDTGDVCELVFDRTTPVSRFIGRSADAVFALDAIGRPARLLLDRWGGVARVGDGGKHLWIPSLSLGLGEGVSVHARIADQKVEALTASGYADPDTLVQLRARLVELLGAPTATDDAKTTWSSAWVAELHVSNGDDFELTVTAPAR